MTGAIDTLSDADLMAQIRAGMPYARAAAAKVGPMHSAWDMIGTAEATLSDKAIQGVQSPWRPYPSRREALEGLALYFGNYVPKSEGARQ